MHYFLQNEDFKKEIGEFLKPLSHTLYNEMYVYVYMISIYIILLMLLALANTALLLKILTREHIFFMDSSSLPLAAD